MAHLPIPTPDEAARLRVLFIGNPIIESAVSALRTFGAASVEDAAVLLPVWARFTELTPREASAVLARFVPDGRFPSWDETSDRVLAQADALDPDDDSPNAAYVREVAQSVIEHRDGDPR